MKKATHALGVVLCIFCFSCGFDELDGIHQNLPEFYALDLSPGCFVPIESGSNDAGSSLQSATMEMVLLVFERELRAVQDFSQVIETHWHDDAWEHRAQDNWQSREGGPSGNHGVASAGNKGHGASAISLSGGQSVFHVWSRDMRAERLYDEDTDEFYLSLREASMYCTWREAGDAQSVCNEHEFEAVIEFGDNAMHIDNYWHEGRHIRWSRHALALENTNNDTTSVIGCDPKTGVSFMKHGRPHYTCWDAGGHETSCRGVNLWPTD